MQHDPGRTPGEPRPTPSEVEEGGHGPVSQNTDPRDSTTTLRHNSPESSAGGGSAVDAQPGDDPLASGGPVRPDPNSAFASQRDRAVGQVSELLGLTDDPEAARGLGAAYDVAAEHSAPFITKVANDMLPDLRADVAQDPGRVIVFVGRDGHSLARATHELDREFFDQHCVECVLSRATVEAAVQDFSHYTGNALPELDQFRSTASKVKPEDVNGSWARLTRYLERSGIPIQGQSPKVTLVDTSYKGTVQVLLSRIYPHAQLRGRYAFFGESPYDPLPGTKQGYALHLTGEAAHNGLPHREYLPDDSKLTFSNKDALGTIEETLHGPYSSPRGIDERGPIQTPQRYDTAPLTGLNPSKIDPVYTDPRVREGVKRANLEAVTDYARHIAALREQGHDIGPLLKQGADSYTDNVRRWVTGDTPDPRFGAVTDSFVRRADKDLVKDLAATLDTTDLSSQQARAVWSQFDELRTLNDKQDFVINFRRQHPR